MDNMEDKKLDDEILAIAKRIEADEAKNTEINSEKVACVEVAYNIIKENVSGEGIKLTKELFTPFRGSGCISVAGKDITFEDTAAFARAVKLSSIFNVYPKTDGTVQMDFGFHGLMRKPSDK